MIEKCLANDCPAVVSGTIIFLTGGLVAVYGEQMLRILSSSGVL